MAQMVLPQVLYDSALHRFKASLSYDGTLVEGFDPENAVDWRDFSLFRADTGTTHLKVQTTAAINLDSFVFWLTALPASVTLYVETSPDDAVWTTRATVAVTSLLQWADFTSVAVASGDYIRVRIANGSGGAIDFRQISVGLKLQFPVGQWNGIAPPTLYSGVVVENVTAVNGSIIGRNVRRLEKSGKLDINLLDPTWIRTYYDPFQRHAGRFAFWYRWHPVGYPTEVAFAAANDIVAPTNDRPGPKMKIEMPMRLLTA